MNRRPPRQWGVWVVTEVLDQRLLLPLARIALVGMMLSISADALSRALFENPLGWVHSVVVGLLMPGLVYLSLTFMARVRGHVRMQFVFDKMPPLARRVLNLLATVLAALLWGSVAYGAYLSLQRVKGRPGSTVFSVPESISFAVVVVGAGIAALFCIVLLVGTRSQAAHDDVGDPTWSAE